jgi:hypothetical protein
MHATGCAATGSARLLFLDKQGEPPDHPDHMIGYDHIVVDVCDTCNGATVEKLRHDCFDFEEVWDQYEWYELSPADGVRLRDIALRCPQPLDPGCACAIHRALRESANALRASGWETVFEWPAHHHPIALSAGNPPRFVEDDRARPATDAAVGAVGPVAPRRLTPAEERWLASIMLLTYDASLVAYFRFADWPWFVDVFVALALLPASVLVGVTLTAFVRVFRGSPKHRSTL